MSPEMTPFDAFEERMSRHLANLRHGIDVELNRLRGEAIKMNAQHNSRSILPKLTAVQHCVEASADDVLTEAKELVDDARRQGKNALDLWREATADKARLVLIAHVEALYACDLRMDAELLRGTTPPIQDSRQSSLAWVNGQVNDFERNISRPKPRATVGGTSVTHNNINIGGNNSGVIQQAGGHAQLQASAGFETAAIGEAIDRVAFALSRANLGNETTAEINAEIATIRAQLTKPKPSYDIIRIATGAIGSVVAGVGANLLTPHVTALMGAVGML